jgi:hypothetical protein
MYYNQQLLDFSTYIEFNKTSNIYANIVIFNSRTVEYKNKLHTKYVACLKIGKSDTPNSSAFTRLFNQKTEIGAVAIIPVLLMGGENCTQSSTYIESIVKSLMSNKRVVIGCFVNSGYKFPEEFYVLDKHIINDICVICESHGMTTDFYALHKNVTIDNLVPNEFNNIAILDDTLDSLSPEEVKKMRQNSVYYHF